MHVRGTDWTAGADLWLLCLVPAGCVAAVLVSYRWHGRGGGLRSLLAYVFPRAVYAHASTRLDLRLAVATLALAPLYVLIARSTMALTAAGLSTALGRSFAWDPPFDWRIGPVLTFTLTMALVSDACTYWIHRLHHVRPRLWLFHRLHHSAEVMTPLTILRRHPAYDLLSSTAHGLALGCVQGLVFFTFAGPVGVGTALGANLVFALFWASGAALRHSHMWLSYGPWLSRILISPAMHQVHHSRARRHWDRNFGEVFALWDWMFGTLYVPEGREDLEFGVAEAPAPRTLRDAYMVPLREALAHGREPHQAERRVSSPGSSKSRKPPDWRRHRRA